MGMMMDSGCVLKEFRAAYSALRHAGHAEANVLLPFVPVLDRELRKPQGRDVRLSQYAAPAASLQFARMRAAWELLPEAIRAKAHLILAVEHVGGLW